MDKKTFIAGLKNHLVDTLLVTGLVTLLLKDFSAYDVITNHLNPKIARMDSCLMDISKTVTEMKNGVNTVSNSMTEIKDKYVRPDEEGFTCRVGQSKIASDYEVIMYADNQYGLTTKNRITIINASTSARQQLTFTIRIPTRKDEETSDAEFFINKAMLKNLGVTDNEMRLGVWPMRFMIVEEKNQNDLKMTSESTSN